MTDDEIFQFSRFMYGIVRGYVHPNLPLKRYMDTYPDISYRPPPLLKHHMGSTYACDDFSVSQYSKEIKLYGHIFSPYTDVFYSKQKLELKVHRFGVGSFTKEYKIDGNTLTNRKHVLDYRFACWLRNMKMDVNDITETDLLIYRFEHGF